MGLEDPCVVDQDIKVAEFRDRLGKNPLAHLGRAQVPDHHSVTLPRQARQNAPRGRLIGSGVHSYPVSGRGQGLCHSGTDTAARSCHQSASVHSRDTTQWLRRRATPGTRHSVFGVERAVA